MPRFAQVLDCSTTQLTVDDCRRLGEQGFQGLIQCVQTGGFSASQVAVRNVAEPNMQNWSTAVNDNIGIYLNSQPWRPAEVIVNDAISVCGAAWSGITMCANDVEISDPSLPYPHITEPQARATQDLILAHGRRAPVYTAWWYARQIGGMHWSWINEGWDADYDGRAVLDFPIPWGPPNMTLVGKQYAGTTNLGGDLFDLNYFDLDYLNTKEEDAMADLTELDKTWFNEAMTNLLQSLRNDVVGLKSDVSWLKAIDASLFAIMFDPITGDSNTSEADRNRRLIAIGERVKGAAKSSDTTALLDAINRLAVPTATPINQVQLIAALVAALKSPAVKAEVAAALKTVTWAGQ